MKEECHQLLDVRDLKTYFHTKKGEAKAVDGVSFGLNTGEALGLVGESGCGKTTSALSICQLLPQNGYIAGGEIFVDGVDYSKLDKKEILPHRWKDVSMIFQGAMNAFNPVKTVGWQIAEATILHDGLDKKDAMKRAGDLLDLVEVPRDRVKCYPHEFSGGMKQRAMIAMALACNPKLVIGDEPTTALDVMVQAQILNLLERLRREIHMSMILITHDLSILGETCDKIAVMYAGKIAEIGNVDDIFRRPEHPYTKKLISCFPDISKRKEIPDGIPGFPPNLIDPPKGCRFAPRCEFACEKCREVDPPILKLSDSHSVACHLMEVAK
jgi:oligopeptide/dipeptide ABC transporter ATP-binding protein